jgi:colanic acid biosynthesis glycosyl transferase WcaI
MRILIWSPNYAPEPNGIPPLVTDAAEWLVARGHSVDVVTAVPNYPERRIHPEYRGVLSRSETLNGVRIHRSWLRARPERSFADKALYELTISTFALPHAVRHARRADVVVCVVPTLLAAAYAAGVARVLNKRLVLWVQDLVLSAAASVGLGAGA